MKPPYDISQLRLSTAIMSELSRQIPNMPVDSKIFNVCIEAANLIVAECARERVTAVQGMGVSAWFESDDTGSSSRYMACKLDGGKTRLPLQGYEYPSDADDFGRCVRMVRACGYEDRIHLMIDTGEEWKQIANSWNNLTGLYDDENWDTLYNCLKLITNIQDA